MSTSRSTNILALPKREVLWQCFKTPDPDYLITHWDFASLEPTVLTYMSQDKNLLKIYGDSGQTHDVYLFVASFFKQFKDKVLQHYSLDGNGTPENLSKIKAILKAERKDTKAPYLGWCYGLGAAKLAFDKQISYNEAKDTLRSIDKAFPGKQRLQTHLTDMWTKNGGWVLNVRGRPVCVPKEKVHDIVNRVTQSGGHDLLLRVLYHLLWYIKEYKVDAKPYIAEIHDEALFLVHKDHIDRYKDAVDYAFTALNNELGWGIKLKHGGITFGQDCSIRCE